MLKARQGKEAIVRVPNEIGALAKLSKMLTEKGLNILAMSAWVEESESVIRLVTDDHLRTTDALRGGNYNLEEKDIVLIDAQHKPGILRHIADTLTGAGIDLSHLFASATLEQEICLVVLNSSNNQRAIVLLND